MIRSVFHLQTVLCVHGSRTIFHQVIVADWSEVAPTSKDFPIRARCGVSLFTISDPILSPNLETPLTHYLFSAIIPLAANAPTFISFAQQNRQLLLQEY